MYLDDAVVVTSNPEEALQAVAAATGPQGPQAVNLEDPAENNPDPEVDNLESGTEVSVNTPRTTIHYSDVD